MEITGSIGIRKENLSSEHGAEGKTMRNLFGVHGENFSSRHGAGGKTMPNLFGILKENLSSEHGAEGKTMHKLFGVHGENPSSEHGAGGKTMRNLFGVHGENLSSRHGAGGKTMRNLFGIGKEHLNSDEGGRTMSKTLGMRWLLVAAGAAMLLVLGAACTKEVEVPGETVVVEKEVVKTVEVPGETIVGEKEVVKTVEVPGQTIVVEKEVVKEVIKTVAGPERVVVREVPGGKNYVTDPTTGKVVSAPQYGGTLTYSYVLVGETTDPHVTGGYASMLIHGVNQNLAVPNWGLDRKEFPFNLPYIPLFAWTEELAESWEQPDDTTIIFHIRQGVYWHDKPPMNGRELTADDVVFNYHRMMAMGDFTEPPLFAGAASKLPWESIEATNKYTVVMKLTEPNIGALREILTEVGFWILPPEVIKEHGDYTDWRNVVGTGPVMLTDYVEGVSKTWTKNPDYWGYDEKYPENRLPYIDKLVGLYMAEEATRVSALRSGKIDIIRPNTQIKSIDVVKGLQRTNPDIAIWPFYQRSLDAIILNIRNAPFDDIRVRHALQMALDLETINDAYYGGFAQWQQPRHFGAKGYYTEWEEWPAELKGYYTYDPEGAERLLDEAGYPRGADGVRFKFEHVHRDVGDLGYIEIVAGYWADIGVDVTISIVEWATITAAKTQHNYESIYGYMALAGHPSGAIQRYGGDTLWARESVGGVENPVLAAAQAAFNAATTIDEQSKAAKEFNMETIKQHFQIWGPLAPGYQASQPWVGGFNGETLNTIAHEQSVQVRLWIDSELKKAMGH